MEIKGDPLWKITVYRLALFLADLGWSDQSEFDVELFLIEYSRSPYYSIAFVGEYTNKNQLRNVDLDRNYWLYGSFTFNFSTNHQLSLLYGSRQEGFICVGGICRYEPEFEGIEIKFINRF